MIDVSPWILHASLVWVYIGQRRIYELVLTARAASGRATTSSLITAISAVSVPITVVSGANALATAAPECSTLTENCTSYKKEC